MRGTLGGPRALLRRLREVMAEPVSAQDRLDKIVVLIAANMVAEVCSVYVFARRRHARTLRHGRPQERGRPSDRHAGGRSLVGLVAAKQTPSIFRQAQDGLVDGLFLEAFRA